MIYRYLYTDGTTSDLLTFSELFLSIEDDSEGVRVPFQMDEQAFIIYLNTLDEKTAQYWFLNDHSSTGWYQGKIQLYTESHELYGQIDGHNEYLEAIIEEQNILLSKLRSKLNETQSYLETTQERENYYYRELQDVKSYGCIHCQ